MKEKRAKNWTVLGLAMFSVGVAGVAFSENPAVEVKAEEEKEKELRGLMLTGGCCHDYDAQKVILSNGISERVPVEWTILHEGGTGGDHQFDLLKKEGWEKDFDFVLYNICFARTNDTEYIESITGTHEAGLPALALHCSLHSYHWRAETDAWRKFMGADSRKHGKKAPIEVKVTLADHPIMKGAPATWTTPQGELYHVKELYDTATVLAEGAVDDVKMPVIWVNDHEKARVFVTSMGHHNETMADPIYLDTLGRALKWVMEKE